FAARNPGTAVRLARRYPHHLHCAPEDRRSTPVTGPPTLGFPENREITGSFRLFFAPFSDFRGRFQKQFQYLAHRFPAKLSREYLLPEQGKSSFGTGNNRVFASPGKTKSARTGGKN